MIQFIDTHQHLILRGHFGYDWTEGFAGLAGREFSFREYDTVARQAILGVLFMESGVNDADYKAEARLIADSVRSGRFLGQISSCRPEDGNFSEWIDECADLGVKGFRRILHTKPDKLSQTTTFLRNLQEIGRRGFSFDLCLRVDQHALGETILRACPSQQFILDHCGNPNIAADDFGSWSQSLALLAKFPHLAVKLSGIPVNARVDQQNDAALHPYMERVVELFGVDRVVWGGDWPVCTLAKGLGDWIDISARFLNRLSANDAMKIAQTNAVRLYRLKAVKSS
jgi:predicted TIM-barrel fold metal-dependent hydrolase